MRCTFKLVIDPPLGVGLDTSDAIKDQVEEALRCAGLDNDVEVRVELVSEEED